MKKTNNEIQSINVILINIDGENKGEMSLELALREAESLGMDLVQMSDHEIPICKIMDIKKIEFEKKKKMKKSKGKVTKLKEIRFTLQTSQHDIDFKSKHIDEFLESGHKVKLTIKSTNKRQDVNTHMNSFTNMILSITKSIKIPHKIDGSPNISRNGYSIDIIAQ